MVEKKEKILIKGLVKSVISGDYITISRTTKTSGTQENTVNLASVQAPKVGSSNRVEEPFAFEAREFLRERIIGKKAEFKVDYQYGGRDYGTLLVDGVNMNLEIVKAGLAKVIEKKGSMATSASYEEMISAQADAKSRKVGLWASADEKFLEKHTRKVTYFTDTGYNPTKLLEEAKSIDKPLESIVEYVFNAGFLAVYVHKFQTQIKLSLVHLFTPQNDKQFVADGKAFVEKFLLNRTVGLKLERVEEGGTLVGRVLHPAGEIAYEILKNGYAKLNTPKNIDFDADYFKTLKEAQLIAQTKSLRIWKDFKQEEKKEKQKASTSDFTGKVVEIHTGDSLTIERDSDFKQFRVFLATVKAPLLMKKPGEDPDPYAWDSKEALRKAAIGKKVRVIMEFSKTVNERVMDFASVFLEKNNKNVSCILLEKGLLKTNVNKSGDNASKFIEDLLASEKKGVDSKQGLFSTGQAPVRIFSDLVQNPKKAKDFEAMVMKRPNRRMNGVVEYCFSGMRFKVRLDQENTAIGLNLLGVKTMANDKNQPQLLEFSNDALAFAKEHLFQRDVVVEPDFADKRGSFFGTITLSNKKDFGLMLIQEGLAQVSVFGTRVPANIDELENAEEQARIDGIGIWDKQLKTIGSVQGSKQVKLNERIQVEMTDITDASRFFLRILSDNQYPKVEALMNKFDGLNAQELEKPIKKGTVCAARFKLDENWYRARVLRSVGKNQYEVEFIDFGNQDTVSGDDLKRLSAELLAFEAQSKQCSLAYVKVSRIDNEFGEEAAKYVQSVAMEQITEAIVVDQQDDRLQVVLFSKGEKDWNKSVNCVLIQKGLASLQKFEEDADDLPEEINDWFDIEEEVKESSIKIWQYGGAGDESD